jgi:hypothetical protein
MEQPAAAGQHDQEEVS